ncbi:MAG: hypothetical protein AAB420_01425 [Patescibacteria group bacterium]
MAKQTILTKEDFESILDKKLKSHTKDIKVHVTKEIKREVGDLAAMTARGFRSVDERFDQVDRKIDKLTTISENHEKRIKRVEKAVGIPEIV